MTTKEQIERHENDARNYLQLASDNLAVAMNEFGLSEASRDRKLTYLGYAEDYSLLAKSELSKAYKLHHRDVNGVDGEQTL